MPAPRRTLLQRIRRVRCWLRGYHVSRTSLVRYDCPCMCTLCGQVGDGIETSGE